MVSPLGRPKKASKNINEGQEVVLGNLREVGWVRTNVDLFLRSDNTKLRNSFNNVVTKLDIPG